MPSDPATYEIGKIFDAISKERKEACIHCGKIWYAIHHKDGVCAECQKKNLPGRSKTRRMEEVINYIGIVISAIIWLVVLLIIIF